MFWVLAPKRWSMVFVPRKKTLCVFAFENMFFSEKKPFMCKPQKMFFASFCLLFHIFTWENLEKNIFRPAFGMRRTLTLVKIYNTPPYCTISVHIWSRWNLGYIFCMNVKITKQLFSFREK